PIVDAQIHLWGTGLPNNQAHRQVTAFTAGEAIALMDAGGVDAAVIHQVLHFADDPVRAIAETARVLRPGGVLVVVDFAPHDRENLRTEHEHRRLGFADTEIGGWFADTGLETRRIKHLPGEPLTVIIWLGIKPEYDNKPETGNWMWMSDIQNAVH
ncbi:MAG: methyltransferase domain-containing protein, partial [Rhodospirillales bacterium]|nr:methyltransferase domain-containing protein [Rhodospirillales bacterium]